MIAALRAFLCGGFGQSGFVCDTTNSSGAAEFPGLENGEYELIEIAAPAGYNQIKGIADTVEVNGNKTSTATRARSRIGSSVDNSHRTAHERSHERHRQNQSDKKLFALAYAPFPTYLILQP